MAKRYSGNLQISVVYDGRGDYRTSVSSGGKVLWHGRVRPAPAGFGPGVAYDSPKAYDEVASSALAFADDEKRGIADEAEFDENLTGYLIRRSPRAGGNASTGHATRKKTPKQLDREIERALSGEQQKRMFYESMGQAYRTEPSRPIVRAPGKDYGSDPLGLNEAGVFMFRMVPSGDVVTQEEMRRRLPQPKLRAHSTRKGPFASRGTYTLTGRPSFGAQDFDTLAEAKKAAREAAGMPLRWKTETVNRNPRGDAENVTTYYSDGDYSIVLSPLAQLDHMSRK